jgi:iron complex transport system substrate-binding protein
MRAILLISLLIWATPLVPQPLPSVISLDYCSDQYVLALADSSQIKAVSVEAENAHSYYKARASGVPKVRAELEELISRSPDVVIRHWAGDGRMVRVLEEYGTEVLTANFGYTEAETYHNLEVISKSLGQSKRGAEYIEDLKTSLNNISSLEPSHLKALYVTPGGVTTGAGTMVDDIITKAGLLNFATELGVHGWSDLPLEQLAYKQPDIIITGFYDHASTKVDNWTFARHAYLLEMLQETPTITLPGLLLSCNGLFLAEAVESIHHALGDVIAKIKGDSLK